MPSLIVLTAVFGAAAGAFLPRLAYRLAVPFGSPPRPACAACSRPFPDGREGWVRAGAACPCGPRPWRTVLASTATAGVLGATVGATPLLPVFLSAAVLGVLLAAIDVRCLRLPDPLVATLALVVGVPLGPGVVAAGEPGRLGRALLAAALFGLGYLALALAPGAGLGLGDVKLAAVLGFILGFLGWPAVAVGVIAPQLINGPIALVSLLRGRVRRGGPLPFGPALLAGALAAIALAGRAPGG